MTMLSPNQPVAPRPGSLVGDVPAALDCVHQQLLRDVLLRFGRARLRVNGTSMLPSLWPGEVIEVERVHPSMLRKGDVLLLQRGQRLFCHRLLRWAELDGAKLLCTRGDHLPTADPLFSSDCLLGRVKVPYCRILVHLVAPMLRAIGKVSERLLAQILRSRAVRHLEA